jgi:multimeric flavodoxin WrbA
VDPQRLLVVSHSQTGGTSALVRAFVDGARDDLIEGVEVLERDALVASADDVLAADAIVLATPENFGYMSGALKYFFDHIYEPCREHTRGRPYALIIKARDDGQGAQRSVERIVTGLAWRAVRPPLIVLGPVRDADLDAANELGMTIAAELSLAVS